MNYNQVKQFAEKYNDGLRADNPRFKRSVQIIDEEGTVLFYRHAFLMEWGLYIICFTEHHGFHVFPKDELIGYNQFETCSCIETLPLI